VILLRPEAGDAMTLEDRALPPKMASGAKWRSGRGRLQSQTIVTNGGIPCSRRGQKTRQAGHDRTAENTKAARSSDEKSFPAGHLDRQGAKKEGVDTIFTWGGHIIDLYDGCIDEGIDHIDVGHAEVADHAAEG